MGSLLILQNRTLLRHDTPVNQDEQDLRSAGLSALIERRLARVWLLVRYVVMRQKNTKVTGGFLFLCLLCLFVANFS
jgi:hypothetical protein